MKCIGKLRLFLLFFIMTCFLAGCRKLSYEVPYSVDEGYVNNRYGVQESGSKTEPFANELCVENQDVLVENLELPEIVAAGLFNLNDRKVICAKDIHETVYPASLTKVMTAVVALENGSLDQILTATDNVKMKESAATTKNLKIGAGYTMTLDQALHILLMASSNEIAMMIAENIGGNVENFTEMMNQKAIELGATNTHFSNPHGLTAKDHYTTVYDMYLIFNRAMQYETFNQIINMASYQTTYHDNKEKEVTFECANTNWYINTNRATASFKIPDNVTVLGGKTGTTNAAGHCLVLHAKDTKGRSYISILMRCKTDDMLYETMTNLLNEINN